MAGCDLLIDSCGMKGTGEVCLLNAVWSFLDKDDGSVTAEKFAESVLSCASKTARNDHSVPLICAEFSRIEKWFGHDGSFYDKSGNKCWLDLMLKAPTMRLSMDHMGGLVNPPTKATFFPHKRGLLDELDVDNLLHNRLLDPRKLTGRTLPNAIERAKNCTKQHLKNMILK